MKRIITKARQFTLPKAAKNVLMVVSFLSIFDVLVAVLGGSYISENIGGFLGKSRTVILSDLLFLEGAIIFAIGAFVALGQAVQETKPSRNPSTEKTVNTELTRDRWKDPSTLMMIVGAILMALSITVGTLLL